MSKNQMFIKNMRWILRDADSNNPYIHVQMLAKEGIGGGNRAYGDAFDVPIEDIFCHMHSMAVIKPAARGDTQSLATGKPYTKGLISIRHIDDRIVMRLFLQRSSGGIKFFLGSDADLRLKEHAEFAIRNGLEITQ